MQTTLNIDEAIVERLHAEAKRRGTTASALAEAGIRRVLGEEPAPDEKRHSLPGLPESLHGTSLVDPSGKEEYRRWYEEYFGEPAPQTAEELMERLPKWQGGELLVDISNKEELRRVMDEDGGKPLPELPKLPPGPMLVDISDREELYRVMDEDDGFRY